MRTERWNAPDSSIQLKNAAIALPVSLRRGAVGTGGLKGPAVNDHRPFRQLQRAIAGALAR